MNGDEPAHCRVRPPQLLGHEREREIVHSRSAVRSGQRPCQEAEFAHPWDELERERAGFVSLARDWRDLVVGEGAGTGLDRALLLGQFKVHLRLPRELWWYFRAIVEGNDMMRWCRSGRLLRARRLPSLVDLFERE